jgi:hypothetical protein
MKLIHDLHQREGTAIARMRSKLFARALAPEAMAQFPDETYRVDFTVPRFEWLIGGKVTTWGPAQLIGSWAGDGTWIWGWENPSVGASAYGMVREPIRAIAELSEILGTRKLAMDERTADRLAAYLSHKIGWLGGYPARNENGGIAFLALKLTAIPEHSVEPAENLWCVLCGQYPSQVKRMVKFAPGMGICNECGEKAGEIAGFSRERSSSQTQDLFSCALCEERNPGVAFPHLFICFDCVDVLNGAA